MRVVLAIIGAMFGLSLSTGHLALFGILLGAVAGYALAEVASLRQRLESLEQQLTGLASRERAERARQSIAGSDTSAPSGERSSESARGAIRPEPSPAADSATASAAEQLDNTRLPQTEGGASPTGQTAARIGEAAAHVGEAPARIGEAAAAFAGAPSPAAQVAPSGAPARSSAYGGYGIGSGSDPDFLRVIREYFTGGNTVVRVGVLILFFGVAFLLRYISEHTNVPIQLRLSGVAVGGVALLGLGWSLRRRRLGYALALQGGGVGILYLTVFAALRLYSLIPPGTTFVLLVAIAALCATLAIVQNSQAFALLAVTGGFLAPILASNGEGNHVALFSYYAVLNGCLFAIAWSKSWRLLNFAGFAFTFVIATVWGALRYRPELFASTEPFLALFFVLYLAIAILFSFRQPPELRGYVDGTLVFGTPIAAFAYQSAMLHDRPLALAFSALALAVLYFVLAWGLYRRQRESQRLLTEAFIALGVVFLTLAVPLAFDDRRSAATWALEGAGLLWVGCRQGRRLSRAFGTLLLIGAGVVFWVHVDQPHGRIPVFNGSFLAGVTLAAASIFSANVLRKHLEHLSENELHLPTALFFWGLAWWLYAGVQEINRHVPDLNGTSVALVFVAATAVLLSEISRRSVLSVAGPTALGLLPAMVLCAGLVALEIHHPFAGGGWFAWPLAFAAFYFVCRRHEGAPDEWPATALHTGSAWLLIALLTWESAWQIDKGVSGHGSWPAVGWVLVPAVALFFLPRLTSRLRWPLYVHQRSYELLAGSGLAAYLAAWVLVTNLSLTGDPYPLPYVPLLNALDLTEALVLLVSIRYWLHLKTAGYAQSAQLDDRPVVATLAALTFIWLNAALLRTLHHWAGVPFDLDAMLGSTLVQTALSIFWTALALMTMLVATRRATRVVWLTGAALLAVVVVKLFVIDLSRVGTVERIVSFVGVGLLTLVIGYFSPLPPAARESPPGPSVR